MVAQHDRFQEVGHLGHRIELRALLAQPGVELTEASSLRVSLRRLGGRKVPGIFQAREKLREPTLTHNLLHGIPRPGYVFLAPTLGYQPALRLRCMRGPATEAVVNLDPVEGGGREDQIHKRFRRST